MNTYLSSRARWLILLLLVSGAGLWVPFRAILSGALEQGGLDSLPAAEFSRLIQDLSEEDGYFRSDNFTSNETSYLHVVSKLKEMRVAGGAYVGVGPEQNFTYIAKIRPRIAFIVDIRRQAMLQHLLYKAVFHTSRNRVAFLSGLLSRAVSPGNGPGDRTPIEEILEYFGSAPAPEETFVANLKRIRKIIQDDFRVALSETDQKRLEYVYSTFKKDGLQIAFGSGASGFGGYSRRFPNLRDLILQADQDGKLGNFLATEEDYRFVRNLHLKNRIIPVVGDFAGSKALASVGDYLRKNGYTVRAYYTSNVEQFLFQNGVFDAYVGNIRKLPIDDTSVFIRAVTGRGQSHPAYVPGHRTTTVLQRIALFLADYDKGLHTDYRSMTMSNYIAGRQP